MIRVGFIVNPYAGLGGSVGLKGTDGYIKEAFARGAVPHAPEKAIRFLSSLSRDDLYFLTAGGEMGEAELTSLGILHECVYRSDLSESDPLLKTSATDTKHACNEMIRQGVHVIVFAGGDGTARDIFSCTRQNIPILGIPAGVKIYSGVFATTPIAAAQILSEWNLTSLGDGEVMDVNEEEYRNGVLDTHLFGFAKVPSSPVHCQSSKQISFGDESHERQEIARFIVEIMRDDTLYLLGAGTTTQAIADMLGISKTLLGIDAIYQKQVVGSDVNEQDILRLLKIYNKVKIIISPIGAQGFILGRGNQQISSTVLSNAGIDSLIVIATDEKMKRTQNLFIDTGDPDLNSKFGDTILVVCGYRIGTRVRLNH